MRIAPTPPPNLKELRRELLQATIAAESLADAYGVRVPMREDYPHWDKLQYLEPPEGMTNRHWWLRTKLDRLNQARTLPLRAKDGASFHFVPTDGIQEFLHELDVDLGRAAWVLPGKVLEDEDAQIIHLEAVMEEAIHSSQLEGAATTRVVAQRMLREGLKPRDHGERMIANSHRVMRELPSMIGEPLSLELLRNLHASLTAGTLESEGDEGRIREQGDTIAVVDERGRVLHEPPAAGLLPARLEALCAHVNHPPRSPYIHPLVRAIILHFMIGYEHPFVDGNGRLARVLFTWSMLKSGYPICRFLSLSRQIHRSRNAYYRAYLETETDEGDLTYFILYNIARLKEELEELRREYRSRAQSRAQVELKVKSDRSLNRRQRELVVHGLSNPGYIYTMKGHARTHGVTMATARSDLRELVRLGLMNMKCDRNPHQFTFRAGIRDTLGG